VSASSPVLLTKSAPTLPNPGQFHYRDGGEKHLNTPASMVHLQAAARNNSREAFDAYSAEVNESNAACTLRGMLRWKAEAVASGTSKKLTIEDIEPVQAIVKRFVTGAMSLGSISQETHESLAVAMNTIGGRSNTGEGGEDPARFDDNRRSAIKQVFLA
jgi:glutamate synthase domain-containing protein 2